MTLMFRFIVDSTEGRVAEPFEVDPDPTFEKKKQGPDPHPSRIRPSQKKSNSYLIAT